MKEWKIHKTNVFDRNYNSSQYITINRGGTRSSKTVSVCQQVFLWLLTGKWSNHLVVNKGVCSIVRKYQSSISKSILRDFEAIYYNCPINENIKYNRTERTFVFDGRLVEFIGADDEQKLRGSQRQILYCNEANELNYDKEFFQLLIRTTHKVVLDFNPDNEYIWINQELEQKRKITEGDVDVIISTYKDNQYLPKRLINEIELLKRTNPDLWKVYGLGEYGSIKGLVFNNWDITGENLHDKKLLGYGLDFGFTNDPTSLIEVRQGDGKLWLKQLIYETGLTNQDIANRIKALNITGTIIADSAEPKSIEELRRLGVSVRPAVKGSDSVRHGINLLNSYQLMVDVNSKDLLMELRSYKYMEGTNKPIDSFNHAIDACRYCVSVLLTKNTGVYDIR